MIPKLKIPAALVSGLVMLYAWSYFLAAGGLSLFLFIAYMVVGFLLSSFFFPIFSSSSYVRLIAGCSYI